VQLKPLPADFTDETKRWLRTIRLGGKPRKLTPLEVKYLDTLERERKAQALVRSAFDGL
jgi:hypothetical protein